ncbi:EID1-like F-box protein 3 [Aristolochia californica]|uniref:EID1-like F-box protein 3 n=1 Tax=Aristolochia californica TaxID=171875 RepID=UPI0035D6A200
MNRRSRERCTGEWSNVSESSNGDSGILDERILLLIFESINWDPRVVCLAACVNRTLCAIAKRVLWRELCCSRAPLMVGTLVSRGGGRVCGGWLALAKLLFFCCGSEGSRHFPMERPSQGHFVTTSRFSKTSGKSFLVRRCWGDILYVTDPCEHEMEVGRDDLGTYRGVFGGFLRSKTRTCLIARGAMLEERVCCPYCHARVWSMTAARLVPRSAFRRLGAQERSLEYFVCVNGHLHGSCWLVPLSSSSFDGDEEHHDEHHDDNEVAESSVGGTHTE